MKRSACLFALLFALAAQAQQQEHTPEQARAREQARAQALEDRGRINALSYAESKRLGAKVNEVLRLRATAPEQARAQEQALAQEVGQATAGALLRAAERSQSAERARVQALARQKEQARLQALARARAEAQAQARERIVSFHSAIKIGAQRELSVTEIIEAQVEGRSIKRGILREFPTDYRDRLGRRVSVPFEVVSVKRDGKAESWNMGPWANGVRVQIGNPGVLLPHGLHTYEISYRTRYQLGFFDDHDELYWNVNGNGWSFAMDSVSADVSLPRPVPAAQLKAEAYTGAFGAKGRAYTATLREGGAEYRTTQALAPREGLTIVFSFPKGVIPPPPWWQPLARWAHDNEGEVAGAAGFLLLLAFLFWRWWMVGRDPRKGPVFPRYEAPTGLGPAGTRYLDRMQCDTRCFAAALLGLGQRGFLRIRQEGAAYTIERTGKAVELLPGEQALATLVPPQGTVTIGRTYDRAVQVARADLGGLLQRHYRDSLFSHNRGSLFLGGMIAFITFGYAFVNRTAAAVLIGGAVGMALILYLFSRWLPAYTATGRKLQDEVEGLRQYLSIAEKDDLARLKLPPRTPEEFAKFLPYALALDVEKTWADAFAAVLGAAAVAQAVSSYYQSGSDSIGGDIGGLTDSIANMGDSISSAATPPGSSSGSSGGGGGSSSGGGSSGGGSSGGGGGGGGGSGW
ncbi:MAG: DUF2207 domain-containing protein [Pseudomonadota bacterium]